MLILKSEDIFYFKIAVVLLSPLTLRRKLLKAGDQIIDEGGIEYAVMGSSTHVGLDYAKVIFNGESRYLLLDDIKILKQAEPENKGE